MTGNSVGIGWNRKETMKHLSTSINYAFDIENEIYPYILINKYWSHIYNISENKIHALKTQLCHLGIFYIKRKKLIVAQNGGMGEKCFLSSFPVPVIGLWLKPLQQSRFIKGNNTTWLVYLFLFFLVQTYPSLYLLRDSVTVRPPSMFTHLNIS